MSAFGTKQTSPSHATMSAFGGKADVDRRYLNVRSLNRRRQARWMRISEDGTAQDSNVFLRQTEARTQLGVIDVDEPHSDTLLTRVVLGSNESANECRTGRGKSFS